MKNRSKAIVAVFLFTTGLFLFVFGFVFQLILDSVISKILHEKLALKEGTIAYKMWLEPPVPINFNIYVFDIVNPMEVQKGIERPVVIEKGPYVFKMHIHKTNISRHDFNDTISYVQPQAFHFDEEASVGSLNDTFTTINIPYITVASSVHSYPAFIQKIVSDMFIFQQEKPFMQLTVNDIFWGYEDPMLKKMSSLAKKFHLNIPYLSSKFGFFLDKNNTGDGYYNVFSGVNGNLDNYCKIDFWNRKRKMDMWPTEKANEIAGTDGSMHPPFVKSDSKLNIFDAYLHRTLHMTYVKDTSYKGLDTLRFVVPFSEFGNATSNPDTAGFCTPNTNHCMPAGCYNLSVASFGAPMYVSMPHFCGGDPYYGDLVGGLLPDPEKHQPFYDIHALTGVSIKGSRRYQINVQMKAYENFMDFKNVPLAYLPIIWIDGMSVIDDHNVSQFRDDIQHLLEIMKYLRYAMIAVGAVILVLALCLSGYWYYKYKQLKKNGQPKKEPTKLSTQQENGANGERTGSEREPLLK